MVLDEERILCPINELFDGECEIKISKENGSAFTVSVSGDEITMFHGLYNALYEVCSLCDVPFSHGVPMLRCIYNQRGGQIVNYVAQDGASIRINDEIRKSTSLTKTLTSEKANFEAKYDHFRKKSKRLEYRIKQDKKKLKALRDENKALKKELEELKKEREEWTVTNASTQ